MQGNSKKKIGAAAAAAVVVAFVAIIIVAFIFIIKGEEDAGADGVLIAYVGLLSAIIIGVLVALWQRFKEISRGEEEESKKY
ncbi:MAG: hypothetical protein IJB73_01115 [Firmicutes bacterium]|nr:hypothetical protein [Bacillota bacterium]